MLSDVMVVASVGSNILWGGTVLPSPVTTGRTIAQFLMESGMTWATRGGIDTNTANGDFGAYVGLARGIEVRGHRRRVGAGPTAAGCPTPGPSLGKCSSP